MFVKALPSRLKAQRLHSHQHSHWAMGYSLTRALTRALVMGRGSHEGATEDGSDRVSVASEAVSTPLHWAMALGARSEAPR